MRITIQAILIAYSFLTLTSTANAQGKVSSKWHCPKESENHQLDVGDVPDHSFVILQGTCSVSSANPNFPEKSATYTEFVETSKDSSPFTGRINMVMDDGDKVFYSFGGTASSDSTKPVHDHWRLLSGTGKFKGIRGSGTCTGLVHPDGF